MTTAMSDQAVAERGWRPPSYLAPPAVAEAAAQAATLGADRQSAQDVVRRGKSTLVFADREDADARATALLEGAKDPGAKARKKAEADIAEATDKRQVLEIASRRARAATRDACAAAAPKWRADVADAVDEMEERGEHLLSELAELIGELDRRRRTLAWLAAADFDRSYSEPSKFMIELHGKRYRLEEVLDLVTACVVPPVAVTRRTQLEGFTSGSVEETVHEPVAS